MSELFSGWPEKIDLFPRLTRIGQAIGRFITPLPEEAPLHTSNHYERSHFEPSDGEAYQPQLPFEVER